MPHVASFLLWQTPKSQNLSISRTLSTARPQRGVLLGALGELRHARYQGLTPPRVQERASASDTAIIQTSLTRAMPCICHHRGLLNINEATVEDLMALPGIGRIPAKCAICRLFLAARHACFQCCTAVTGERRRALQGTLDAVF